MSNIILETKNLSKCYKSQLALSHVNLRLEQGRIYGLIGKNGAGKTTFMRMIAGLGFPTEGTIKLFGKSSRKELEEAGKRIGSLIEFPGLVAGMTAKENMHLQCLMKGIPISLKGCQASFQWKAVTLDAVAHLAYARTQSAGRHLGYT